MSTTRNDAFFHRLCENIGFILIGVDPDLRVCFWNDHAARQFGASAEQALGRLILDFIHESDRKQAEDLFRGAVTQGAAGETEIRDVDAAGRRTTLVLIISPIIDSHGKRIGASASMRDISERKRLSHELARNRRMAALGGMAQGVAHHFNNILGGMLTSIDYVLSSDSPRELRRTLRLLAQAVGRATRITQQLEAFAKSGHEKAEWAELNELVRRFVERLGPRSSRQKIRLDTHIETIPSGDFEAQRLLPVLDSIAQNGFDAMSPGGTLTVRVEKESDEAVIRISDTGCGIPEDMLDRIFEPFFTTKGELAGGASNNAGLGLAAVHGLVSEIGGTIEVRSKVGEGTTVEVHLPLSRDGPAVIVNPSKR